MYSTMRMTMAGLVAAVLAAVPAPAGAQTQGSSAADQQSPTGTPQATGGQDASSGGAADQAAVRQHLSAARQALAELTKLPAAAQLQGEQRTAITKFISDFNTFATASTDWRAKYKVVDESLDQLLADAPAGAEMPPATTPTPATPPAAPGGAAPTPEAGGPLDPAIIEKLQTVRTELNGFEEASGDPVFIVEAIEEILEESSTGGGAATIPQDKVQEIRRQLDRIRKAAGA